MDGMKFENESVVNGDTIYLNEEGSKRYFPHLCQSDPGDETDENV